MSEAASSAETEVNVKGPAGRQVALSEAASSAETEEEVKRPVERQVAASEAASSAMTEDEVKGPVGRQVALSEAASSAETENEGSVGSRIFRLTLEIPLFLMFFNVSLTGAVVSNLLLQRTCLHSLGYNESVCADLVSPNRSDDMRHVEEEVQSITTVVMLAKSVLEALFPAMLSLFLGVWSNTHGRKPLIVWPLFGSACSQMLVCAYSLLGGVGPWWYVATSLPLSLSGGGSALYTGAFCYMNDITNEDTRSFRLALVESLLMGGMIFGTLVSSYLVTTLGTPYLLLLTSCLAVIGYVYANLCIDESVKEPAPGGLRSIFDVSFVKDVFQTCFKRRQNHNRPITFLLVIANSVSIFTLYGLGNVDYLYAREKLTWGLKEYNIFSAYNMVGMVVGVMLGVTVLQRRYKLSDALMTMAAFVSSMADVIGRAIATSATSWIMYLGSTLSLLRGLYSPLIRSLISKRESPDDVAKVFTLMSSLEAVLPVFSPLVYTLLYKYTLSTLPSAVYIMTLGIYAACLAMTCVAQHFMVKYPVHHYSELES